MPIDGYPIVMMAVDIGVECSFLWTLEDTWLGWVEGIEW